MQKWCFFWIWTHLWPDPEKTLFLHLFSLKWERFAHYNVHLPEILWPHNSRADIVQRAVGSSKYFGMKLLLFWQILYHQQTFTMVTKIHRALSNLGNNATHVVVFERSPIDPFSVSKPFPQLLHRRATCDGSDCIRYEYKKNILCSSECLCAYWSEVPMRCISIGDSTDITSMDSMTSSGESINNNQPHSVDQPLLPDWICNVLQCS